MKAALLLSCSCWLLGCVLDTSLGNHTASAPASEPESEQHAPATAADAAGADETDETNESAPTAEPDARDAATEQSDSPAADQPAHDAAPEPGGDMPGMTDMADMADMPAEPADPPRPMDESPPAGEDPPAPVHTCDMATDNPCLVCDQEACCEPRQACLENAACACHLQCRSAENPAGCREACDLAGERYEPWVACLEQHCAEHCTL